MAAVVYTRSKIDSLTSADVYRFLYTFSTACKYNSEFTEVSNEVLMSENLYKDSINQQYIFDELANPVSEVVSFDDVLHSIRQLQIPDSVKRKLIENIREVM